MAEGYWLVTFSVFAAFALVFRIMHHHPSNAIDATKAMAIYLWFGAAIGMVMALRRRHKKPPPK